VLLAVPLIAHAYAGLGARYVGDDYCAGYVFRDHGLLGGQWWFYRFWGAVPTTVLFMALTNPGGPGITGALPAAAIVCWVMASAWAVHRIASLAGRTWGWERSLLVGEVIVFATIQDAPNAIQSLYLRVPMLAYTAPLLAATLYAGMLASLAQRRSVSVGATVASAAAAFVAGAFGPVYVAMQTVALGAGVLAAALTPGLDASRSLRRLFLAGVAGSIAGLAFVALGPGNALRQHHFPHPPNWPTVVVWSVLYALFMFARPLLPALRPAISALAPAVLGSEPAWLVKALAMTTSPVTLLLAIGVPALLMWTSPGQRADARLPTKWILIALPLLAFGLVAASMAPGAYGTSAPPPPRALIIPQFAIVCAAVAWGCALASAYRPGSAALIRMTALVIMLIAIGQPMASTRRILRQADELHAWALRWDDTNRALELAHARGETSAIVPAVGSIGGVGSIGLDPTDWVNVCAAQYYGLERISGTMR
jgi:hypothetical protein